VYILRCDDDSLYTGVTSDLEGRLQKHNEGVYETCYTCRRRPVELVYAESFRWIFDAIDREKQIKRWSREKKEALIAHADDVLHFLAVCQNGTNSRYYMKEQIVEVRACVFDVMVRLRSP